MSESLSRERKINELYLRIAGVPDPETGIAQPGTGIAEPGDLFFFIDHYPDKTLRSEVQSNPFKKAIRILIRSKFRKWCGYERDDLDGWHVGIYYMGKKRSDHRRINPWMIHSHPPVPDEEGGVHVQHLSPKAFDCESPNSQRRLEILQFEGLRQEQRKKIVDFAISKVGLEFDLGVAKHAGITYGLGLPNFLHNPDQYACQQLVISAYAAAGIYFSHPYKSFPIFNIGRLLGHPLGHPKDRVDPRYPYLYDHHIYRDPRFALKAVLYQNPNTGETIFETKNLEKYSWRPGLKEKYLGGHDGDA
jgi:hypothetical protein